jgi:hypothetical protein
VAGGAAGAAPAPPLANPAGVVEVGMSAQQISNT